MGPRTRRIIDQTRQAQNSRIATRIGARIGMIRAVADKAAAPMSSMSDTIGLARPPVVLVLIRRALVWAVCMANAVGAPMMRPAKTAMAGSV